MARGFESKDVEFQQAEAERRSVARGTVTPEERDRRARLSTLELSLARAQSELSAARSDVHRRMLRDAIATLQEQLGRA
jgi:hypothetical protein